MVQFTSYVFFRVFQLFVALFFIPTWDMIIPPTIKENIGRLTLCFYLVSAVFHVVLVLLEFVKVLLYWTLALRTRVRT